VDEWRAEMRRSGQYMSMLTFKKSQIGRTALKVPERWLKGDPVRTLEEHLLTGGMADEPTLDAVRQEVQSTIADAITFARTSPEPSVEAAATGVFAGA
jgi:TPP-dependent pyruvate/acetoin dehydrogenase alpha subunit